MVSLALQFVGHGDDGLSTRLGVGVRSAGVPLDSGVYVGGLAQARLEEQRSWREVFPARCLCLGGDVVRHVVVVRRR